MSRLTICLHMHVLIMPVKFKVNVRAGPWKVTHNVTCSNKSYTMTHVSSEFCKTAGARSSHRKSKILPACPAFKKCLRRQPAGVQL